MPVSRRPECRWPRPQAQNACALPSEVIGTAGFEPATSASQTRRSNQAELRPAVTKTRDRAGAHNVIGALWEARDDSTPQLMDAFYRELFQGKDAATALRDAKLGLLRSADPDSVFRKPFYWAPFQLYAGS